MSVGMSLEMSERVRREQRASSPWYGLEKAKRADSTQSVSEGGECRALGEEHQKAVHRLEEVGVALRLEQLKAEGCV